MLIKKYLPLLFIFFSTLFLNNCSQNSEGGYTVGVKGSSMWFATAPRNEINAHMDNYETYELCILWESNYPGSGSHWRDSRAEISKTLLRRDIDPLYCSDPSADKVNAANQKTKKAERKAKLACDEAKRAYKTCKLSDSSYCSKPNC